MKSKAFDWPGMMRLGFGALRLPPEVFWSMSPAEFRCALEGAGLLNVGIRIPMDRSRLEALMTSFPDHEIETKT